MKSEQIKEITERAAQQLVAALKAGRSELLTGYLRRFRVSSASAHLERGGSEETSSFESMFGCRVPRAAQGNVPTSLRNVVGAAADRTLQSGVFAQCGSRNYRDRIANQEGTLADAQGTTRPNKRQRLDS